MKPFRELSRRGWLRRFRELASMALAAYKLAEADLSFIQYGENVTCRVDAPGFSVTTGNRNPYLPNRYLLRIHAVGDIDGSASGLSWLAALNQEAGLPVPAPVSRPDGKLLATIVTPGMPHGRVVSLMRWLGGQRFHQRLHPKHLTALGQVLAKMHSFSAGWHPPLELRRPHWDWDAQLGGSLFEHPCEELVASMPSQIREPFEAVSQSAKRVMESLGKGSDAYGLIHADP